MTAPAPSDLQLLHAVRIRGMPQLPEIALITGTTLTVAATRVEQLCSVDQLLQWSPRGARWSLTSSGVDRHSMLLSAELGNGQRHRIAAAHQAFHPLDALFTEMAETWRNPTLSRRASATQGFDPDLDATERILDPAPLHQLHDRVLQLLELLTATAPRFGPYVARLGNAEHRIRERILAVDDRRDVVAPAPLTHSGEWYGRIWTDLRLDFALTLAG